MKPVEWSEEKNKTLKENRGISFEIIADIVLKGMIIDNVLHPNQKRYPGQHIFIVRIGEYCYLVPYVEDDEKIFLKTCYPSRKYTKKFKQEEL